MSVFCDDVLVLSDNGLSVLFFVVFGNKDKVSEGFEFMLATLTPGVVLVLPKLSIIDCVDGSIEGNTLVDIGSNGVPVTFEDVTGLVVAPDNGEFEFESEFNNLPR